MPFKEEVQETLLRKDVNKGIPPFVKVRNPLLELGRPQEGGCRDASRMKIPADELIVQLEERRVSQEIGVHRRFTLVALVEEVLIEVLYFRNLRKIGSKLPLEERLRQGPLP